MLFCISTKHVQLLRLQYSLSLSLSHVQDQGDSPDLVSLKESLHHTQPVGSIVSCARTLDQAKAVLVFIDAISEKTLRSTVTLTAARGRGKSAALGLGIAAAVTFG